jgi:hypothetical protein
MLVLFNETSSGWRSQSRGHFFYEKVIKVKADVAALPYI